MAQPTTRDQLSVLYHKRKVLEESLGGEFWLLCKTWLVAQMQGRKELAFNQVLDQGSFERLKGEISGLLLASVVPDMILADASREIEVKLAELREGESEEEENGTTD